MVRCIVVKLEPDEIIAKVLDKYIDPENEYIHIDTSFSPSNKNANFRNIPIGTYFTFKDGLINGLEKKK
jgi:hypothetical protein